jgi:hypothetical protein
MQPNRLEREPLDQWMHSAVPFLVREKQLRDELAQLRSRKRNDHPGDYRERAGIHKERQEHPH